MIWKWSKVGPPGTKMRQGIHGNCIWMSSHNWDAMGCDKSVTLEALEIETKNILPAGHHSIPRVGTTCDAYLFLAVLGTPPIISRSSWVQNCAKKMLFKWDPASTNGLPKFFSAARCKMVRLSFSIHPPVSHTWEILEKFLPPENRKTMSIFPPPQKPPTSKDPVGIGAPGPWRATSWVLTICVPFPELHPSCWQQV